MANGAKRNKLVQDIQRLRELDAGLRGDGINVVQIAETWETATRSVHRYLDVLRELVGPTEAHRGEDGHFRQRYSGMPERKLTATTGKPRTIKIKPPKNDRKECDIPDSTIIGSFMTCPTCKQTWPKGMAFHE